MNYISLILGIIYFLIFAYDIENDRDFWSWVWLLCSIINFITYITITIKDMIKP